MAALPWSLRTLLILLGFIDLLAAWPWDHKVDVVFVLNQHAQYGQVFKIVGGSDELSNWTPSHAANMTWTPGDAWAYNVRLNVGVKYKYKAVVVNYETGECNCWMPGDNRSLTVPSDYSYDSYVETVVWNKSCGNSCSNKDACSIGGACPSIASPRLIINSIV